MRLTTRHHDAGVTLIELLIAVAVLAVITAPLANAIIGYLRVSDAAFERMVLSHDAQISAAYFAGDVASLGVRDYSGAVDSTGTVPFKASVQTAAAFNAGATVCGTSATPVAVVRFLSDNWNTSAAPPVAATDVVAYYLKPVGPATELWRMKCSGPAPTPVSDTAIAHNVDPATVSVTCSSSCTGSTPPERVTLSFTVQTGGAAPYPVTLSGQRRQT
ncbi:PulJ/GspJ family protein [Lentzea aerocolonigenes]|uniref:PulJ/GspJ family protein n=1 Tax=Lentzea aerocolonigenes TaxID=68170 RepID=UPI000AD39B97|nr:prepilin-type N-terminal cleavage/methylation domain-containing protein [Lentzea aerocolonigenes]MCP2243563.1 prepilin-type N-terminal cleavage/methylation domain-containing protein [Lentzea aerocolonigenes]